MQLMLTSEFVNLWKWCSPRLCRSEHHFLGLTNPDVNLNRMPQLYNDVFICNIHTFQVKTDLETELSITKIQLGWLDTAFLLPYAVMQVMYHWLWIKIESIISWKVLPLFLKRDRSSLTARRIPSQRVEKSILKERFALFQFEKGDTVFT